MLIEHCGIQESTQPWRVKHPPQYTARAVRGHILFPVLRCALATAYRWPCDRILSRGSSLFTYLAVEGAAGFF